MSKKIIPKTALLLGLSAFISFSAMAQKGTQSPKPATSKGNAATKKPDTAPPAPATPATVQIGKKDYKNVGREPGNYAIKVKLKGFKNTNIFLADNFGDKQYFRDTCMLDANGVGTFTGAPKLQRGMYMIVFPELNGYYEIPITDDQTFYFEGDTSMDETKIVVSGSTENEAFATYQKTRAINGRARYNLDNQIKSATAAGNTELKNALTVEKDSLDKRDLRYRESYMSQNPNHLLTKLFKAFQNIKIPENPNPNDSMFEYNYFRNHYWDNVDFNESGLIRAPQGLLTMKLNDYIDKVTFQDYDSLTRAVDIAIGKTVPYTEIQKYFIQYLTNKFQDRKIMCQDNVTIHLINKYYCSGDAWWYDDTAGKRKMCEEAKRAIPTMCGRIAPDLNLADTAGKYHRLYENLGKYTIIFFYDPTCGHCKEVIPVVNEVFKKHKNNGIKVYAVSSEGKYNEWMKMMRERPELHGWVNVCKTNQYYPWPYNRYDYNIQANPTILIVDEQGKILGKKIDEHQLEFFLESLMYEKGIIKTKPTPPTEKPEPKKEG